jgi:hypothetical protein
MEDIEKALQAIQAYRACINRIDDYFEYSNESVKDRKMVHKALADLTNNLMVIYK